MTYHIFRKDTKSGSKNKVRWYYWYLDPITKKRIQKVCKNCTTKKEAQDFIESLSGLGILSKHKIKDIAQNMYQSDSKHLARCNQTGHIMTETTLIENRRYIKRICETFGEMNIEDLRACDVLQYLLTLPYKSSWKNHYISVLTEVFVEANWNGISVSKLTFSKFYSTPRKADILEQHEIAQLFQRKNFKDEKAYLFYLLELSAGLRIGETRAFRPCQMLGNGLVLVNGFLDKNTNERKNYNKSGSEENPKWRIAIIPHSTEELILDYIKRNQIDSEELIFATNNIPMTLKNLRKKFSDAIANSGIDVAGRKITSHSLRYTYVTMMRSVCDADIVRQMAGHSTMRMTDYYTRPNLQILEQQLLPISAQVGEFLPKK